MHVFLSKSTMFESTDFASVMIDDVGCSVPSVWLDAIALTLLFVSKFYFIFIIHVHIEA